MRTLHLSTTLSALAAALLLPCTAAAADPAGPADPPAEPRGLVLVDGGETTSVTVEDGELTVVTKGVDGTTVRVVDLDQMGLILKDGLGQAAEILQGLQLDVHMGGDNRVEFSHGDQTVEVDVDAIAAEVARVLQQGLGELDTAAWTDTHGRAHSDEELRAELDALKRELARLQEELAASGDI